MHSPKENTDFIGQLHLEDLKGNLLEKWLLRVGRLSLTSQGKFYLFNFWVRAEASYRMENGETWEIWGPTLEVVHQHEPRESEAGEWILREPFGRRERESSEGEAFYRTGYYNGFHQEFLDYEFKLIPQQDHSFLVSFRGVPSQEKEWFVVTGFCKLPLQEEFRGYF